MTDPTDEMAVEEYKSCRALIASNIDIMEKSEVYTIGAAAASAVFCLSSKSAEVMLISSFLPLVLSVLGLLRYRGLDATIGILNNYFEKMEINRGIYMGGWASYCRDNKGISLQIARMLLWIALIGGSLIFLVYVNMHHAAIVEQNGSSDAAKCASK